MGKTVSKEEINRFVIDNYEVAYHNSETSYDFKEYFRNQAINNNIDLDDSTNDERLEDVLDSHISNFEKRKKEDQRKYREVQESQKKVDSLLNKIEEQKRDNEKNQQVLKRQLERVNSERYEENMKYKKMNEVLMNRLEKNEKENRRREEHDKELIRELQTQREKTENENRRREEHDKEIIRELKTQREKTEKENRLRDENHLRTIRDLQEQNKRIEKDNKIREEQQLKVIKELEIQRKKAEEENKIREQQQLEVIKELEIQRKKAEEENKKREQNQQKIIEELNLQRQKIEKESRIREENQLNTIIQLQNQREKSEKENKEQIQKMQNKFNEQLQELINKNNENINQINDKYQRMISEANKKAEEEKKALEEKYKNEQNEQKKNINKEFDEKVESEIQSEIDNLKEKFKKEGNSFCMEKIKSFKLETLKDIIIALFTKENIGSMLIESIKVQLVQLLDQPNRKVNHLNILVIGKTGAGKSSLIGEMLRYDNNYNNNNQVEENGSEENNPKPGFFKPTTKGKPKYYESVNVPFLRFADTQGIEISSKKSKNPYGIDEVERDVTEFIINMNESGNPDKYVHCIWYCFQPHDSRLQDDEEELLTNLSKNYSIETLPIILVGTKSNSRELVKQFQDNFENCELPFKFEFIPTLAKKMDSIEPYGLDILQKQSIIKSMSAVQSKCYQGILQDVKSICLNNLKGKSQQISTKIEEYKDNCLKEMSKGVTINDLKYQIMDIFITILNDFNSIILNENKIEGNKELKKESLDYLRNFIDSYFQNCLEGYIDSLQNFVNNNTNDIVNNILDFQNIFNNSHDNLVYAKTKNQWVNIIKKKILQQFIKQAEIFCNINSFTFLTNLLAHAFADAYFSTYKKILESKEEKTKEIDELIQNKIKSQFIDIENKIDEFLKKREEEEKKRKEEEEKKRKEEEEKKKKEEEEKLGKGFENGLFSGVSLF